MSFANTAVFLQPDERIGDFIIEKPLPQGKGGMATVYIARPRHADSGLPPRVALKISRGEHQSFIKHEAEMLRRFAHPHVPRLYALPRYPGHFLGHTDARLGPVFYYAMEYINGGNLRRRLDRGRLPPYQAIAIACQLADALVHIHSRRVINLDIKPENVLLRHRWGESFRWQSPQVVLCDFGIARALGEPGFGITAASIPYVSPEQAYESGNQAKKNTVTTTADLFLLGMVLYEMLTGAPPFADLIQIVDASFQPPPPAQLVPGLPVGLDYITQRALARDVSRRYQRAEEMLADLRQVSFVNWRALQSWLAVGLAVSVLGWGATQIEPPDWGVFVDTATPTIVNTETAVPPPTSSMTPVPPTAVTPSSTPTPLPTITATDVAHGPTSTPAPTRTPTPTFTPRPTWTPSPVATP